MLVSLSGQTARAHESNNSRQGENQHAKHQYKVEKEGGVAGDGLRPAIHHATNGVFIYGG